METKAEDQQQTQDRQVTKASLLLPVGIGIVLVGVVLGVSALGKGERQNVTGTPTATPKIAVDMQNVVTGTQPSTTPMSNSGKVITVKVEGGMFYFSPNTIKVNKGDTVKIVFTNIEGKHDFVIDEFNVKTEVLAENATQTIKFVADKVGSFEYYCSVQDHRQMGMKGTLTVE